MPAPKGVDTAKYDRCVKKVKKRGGDYNAYAVCGASLKKQAKKQRKSIGGRVLEALTTGAMPQLARPVNKAKHG